MRAILQYTWLAGILISSNGLASGGGQEINKCPELTIEHIKETGKNRILNAEGHKWYMLHFYEAQESLGNHVPLEMTVADLKNTIKIHFLGELERGTCRYKLLLEKHKHANVTYKMMGE